MPHRLATLFTLLGLALLTGCASLTSVTSDVSSFGDWPAGRQPGSYAFERLPSQQAQAAEADRLEALARPALAKAGFQPVAAGELADVLVQVGARIARTDRLGWEDPFWWRGGAGWYGYGYGGAWRYGPWFGPGWGPSYHYYDSTRYQREVALLIRDRASGKPLFETRAVNESFTTGDDALLALMFEAALMDFPRLGVNPRRVVVQPPP